MFWWAELISQFFCKMNSSKYFSYPSGKLRTESHNWIKTHILFGMVNEAKYLEWNCELRTRLSDIVSHLCNNYCQILTQQLQKCFSTCHFKMFLKPLSPFEEPKTNTSIFQSKPEHLSFLVLNWTTNSWRGIKNLFRSRQRENKKILWTRPRKWQDKVQPNKTEKRQRRKCQGRLSHIQKKK